LLYLLIARQVEHHDTSAVERDEHLSRRDVSDTPLEAKDGVLLGTDRRRPHKRQDEPSQDLRVAPDSFRECGLDVTRHKVISPLAGLTLRDVVRPAYWTVVQRRPPPGCVPRIAPLRSVSSPMIACPPSDARVVVLLHACPPS
jgi:hypothetical protein